MSLGRFASLPTEIRILIFEHIYATGPAEIAVSRTGAFNPPPFSPCRQLRAESLELIFARTTFTIAHPAALVALGNLLSRNSPGPGGAALRLALIVPLLDVPFWHSGRETYVETTARELFAQANAESASAAAAAADAAHPPPPQPIQSAASATPTSPSPTYPPARARPRPRLRPINHNLTLQRSDVASLYSTWGAALRKLPPCIRRLHLDLDFGAAQLPGRLPYGEVEPRSASGCGVLDETDYVHEVARLAQFGSTLMAMRTRGRCVCCVTGGSDGLLKHVRGCVVGQPAD